MRRRQFLTNLAVTAAAAGAPTTAAAAAGAAGGRDIEGVVLAARIRDAMLGTGRRTVLLPPERLRAALEGAARNYDACRYEQLADGLPRLLASGHAATGHLEASAVLAETYNLVTRLLIKFDDGLGWVAADRARSLAEGADRPLVAGEAARNLAVLARRAGWHSQATQIALEAAEAEALRGSDPALTAERGLLVMSAAYTAAHAHDRSGMRELTAQAAAIAGGLGERVMLRDHGGGFSGTAVKLHLISAEYAAGDPSAAIAAARRVAVRQLPTAERRARYWSDVARAYGMWGRREECLRALLAAEHTAPQETHARPAVRDLVTGLLISGRNSPELRGLAARCGIA